jgi:hypothetical protein
MLVREKDLKSLNVRLCPQCLERYTKPCAAVVVEEDADGVGHIVLLRYYRLYEPVVQPSVVYDAVRCCGGQKWYGELIPARCLRGFNRKGVVVIGYPTLVDAEFVSYLLRRYPALRGELLTESALRKAGCDLEVEIAMWQLAGSE